MELELTSGLILLLATIPVALGLSWYAWSCRSLPGAAPFAAMIPLAALWATAGVFEFAVTELDSKLFWANIQYISITLLPVALLALAASYTGRHAWLSWRRLLALCIVPLITQLLLWTDGYHHLMRATVWLEMAGSHPLVGRTFGPWFWIHCAYSYTLMAIAMVMLVGAIKSAPPFYRRQPVAILVGFFIPFAYNVVFIFDPENMPPFDFTPAALALAGVIIAWGLFRIRVFNLVPAARHNLVENMSDGVLVLDLYDRVLDINRSAQTLIGKPLASILARPIANSWETWAQMIAPHSAGASQADLRIDKDGDRHHYEVKWSPLNHRGQLVGRVVALRDVTDRVRMEENLRRQTLTDDLTGLPNRSMFMDRLNDAIRQARRRSDAVFAVMVLDLDRFKLINDSIGHQAGDMLLQSVATKLKRCVREVDTVARMGGDEFMILLHEMTSARDVLPILERMQEELKIPVYFRQQEMSAACSTGVVIWNPSYKDPEDLLRAADTAMYQAKEAGRGCHRIFDEEMHRSVMQTLQAETDLRVAIRQRSFSLAYQPIVELSTGRVRSLEALIRWRHPERGTLLPDEFITIAENSGLIVPVGEIAMEEVCSQISRWQSPKNLAARLPVSLNLSPRQLIEPEFVSMVVNRLSEWRIPSDRMIFEITEAALIRDPLRSKEVMRELQALGIRLCLDDFGTGQSSLLHLTTFPVHDLKIDRTFISRIARGNTDSEVVRSLIALAHTLGLQVTAEGLETSEQWRLLEELGCDRAQGYYVGRPMAPAELLDCLEELERGSCRLAKSDTLLSEEPTLDNASRVFERPALGRA